jgi:hypothetical protein
MVRLQLADGEGLATPPALRSDSGPLCGAVRLSGFWAAVNSAANRRHERHGRSRFHAASRRSKGKTADCGGVGVSRVLRGGPGALHRHGVAHQRNIRR